MERICPSVYVWKLTTELASDKLIALLLKETGKVITDEEREKILSHQLSVHYNFAPGQIVIATLSDHMDEVIDGKFLASFMFETKGVTTRAPNSLLQRPCETT